MLTELAIFTLFGCFADLHYVSALNHGGGLNGERRYRVCVACVCECVASGVLYYLTNRIPQEH